MGRNVRDWDSWTKEKKIMVTRPFLEIVCGIHIASSYLELWQVATLYPEMDRFDMLKEMTDPVMKCRKKNQLFQSLFQEARFDFGMVIIRFRNVP